jgi:hypothetical protein
MTGIEPFLLPVGAWAWENYGKDAIGWLVKRLAKRVEDVKSAGWERVDWVLASRTYRQELQRLYGSMQIFGMARPIPLTDIFTDIYLLDKPTAWRRHSIDVFHTHTSSESNEIGTAKRYNGVDLVHAQSRLFILGQPGAGKTTFLKYLVMQAISGELDAIPIFIPLKSWWDSNVDLLAFMVRQFTICGFPDAQPFVEHILEEGKAIVLFDRLDEVNLESNGRHRITRAIHDCVQQYGKSRMVITCRTAATEYIFERFNYCEVADSTEAQIDMFVERWFQHDEAKREAFRKAFSHEEHKGLRDLARRPLLLTMLCLTFEETMAFPRRRAELYEEAIGALLKKWDSSRSIQRDTIYHKMSLGYKRQLLMELAAETFEKSKFFIPKRDMVERVTRFLRRLPPADFGEDIDGEAVLRAIEAQHGLLIERSRDIYSFSHLTFHEYFAACYIADHPEDSVLRGAVAHAADTQWREVLLLTASLLDHRNVESLFRIWFQVQREPIENDAALRSFITLFAHTAGTIIASDSAMRAGVISLTIIEQVFTDLQRFARELDNLFADPRTDTSVSAGYLGDARDTALTHIRAINRAVTGARAYVRADNQHPSLTSLRVAHPADNQHPSLTSLRVAHGDAGALVQALRSILGALRRTRSDAHDLIDSLVHAFTRATEISEIIRYTFILLAVLDRIRHHCVRYQHRDSAASIPMNLNLESSKDPKLKLEQLGTLAIYVTSTYRLLECLDVAAIEDRIAILDQLLILPD